MTSSVLTSDLGWKNVDSKRLWVGLKGDRGTSPTDHYISMDMDIVITFGPEAFIYSCWINIPFCCPRDVPTNYMMMTVI